MDLQALLAAMVNLELLDLRVAAVPSDRLVPQVN
jgi:hypothetical protein